MYNPHPVLSAFPFALLVAVFCFEIWGLLKPNELPQRSAGILLGMVAMFSLAAFFSGYYASDHANQTFQIPDDVIAHHHAIGRFLLFTILPCFLVRVLAVKAKYNQRTFWLFYYLLLLASLTLVIWTGYLGGELVFSYGAGVRV